MTPLGHMLFLVSLLLFIAIMLLSLSWRLADLKIGGRAVDMLFLAGLTLVSAGVWDLIAIAVWLVVR